MAYEKGHYVPPHLRTKQRKVGEAEDQAATRDGANPSAQVSKSSPTQSGPESSTVAISLSAPSETGVQLPSNDLKSAANFDVSGKVKVAPNSPNASGTATPLASDHPRSTPIKFKLPSSRTQSPSTHAQSSPNHSQVAAKFDEADRPVKPAFSAAGESGLTTSFSPRQSSQRNKKQAVSFTTPAKQIAPSHLESSGGSQRADQQSIGTHGSPPGLTGGTSASYSIFEVTPMPTTITTLLPAAITPKIPQAAAPVQLATSLAEFSQSQPASPPTPTTTPPEAHAIVPTTTVSRERRGGWLTREESREMKKSGRAYDDCIIDEDAFEGGNQNNGWPADENSPELCLRQWDGDWLPPPVDWQARNPYKRPDRFAADIATWVDRTNAYYLTIHNGTSKLVVNVDAEPFKNNAENVPRSWIPESLEKMPLQSFWQCLRQSSLQPVDEEDMDFAPYWLRYITTNPVTKGGNDFQELLTVPDAHLDPGDEDVEMYRKGKSQTQKDLIYHHNRKVRLLEKRKDGARRKHNKALRKEAQQPVIAPPPNPHKPVANIYLRPASHRDFLQMIQIYNHYAGTHYSYAMTPMTLEEMAAKKRDIDRAEMIMIVAIQKTKQNLPRGHPTNLQSTQEKVVGFAFTDEHEGHNALFRYAADLECYVHPEYLRRGIGKSLVDRMLWFSNPYYRTHDAVEWRPMSDEHYLMTPGGKRILDSVRVQVFYPAEKEGETRLVWIQRWLEQFNFKKWGVVEGGIKLHKRVNMACFIHNRDIPIKAAGCPDNVSL